MTADSFQFIVANNELPARQAAIHTQPVFGTLDEQNNFPGFPHRSTPTEKTTS